MRGAVMYASGDVRSDHQETHQRVGAHSVIEAVDSRQAIKVLLRPSPSHDFATRPR
jgi:hypothetical protein